MRSPGATGPAELSVTGRRYSSGWAHSQRLKLRAKASRYCSPRQREMGVQGRRAALSSPCPPQGGGVPGNTDDGPGHGGEGGEQGPGRPKKIFLGPKALAKGTKTGPRGERWVLPFLRDHPYLGLPLHPPTPAFLWNQHMCPQLCSLIPQGPSLTPCLSLWEAGASSHPGPHLLMQIVVKQDQVEVSLQALQGPLPDTLLAAASLRGGDRRDVGEVKMGLLWPYNPTQEGQELSLRNPRRQSTSPFTQFCQLGVLPGISPAPLQQVTQVQGELRWLRQALQFPMQGLPPQQALSPETGWGSPTAPAPPRGQHPLCAEAARGSASPLSQRPSPPFAWDPPYKKTKRPS